MNYQDLFAKFGRTDTPARAALIGVGQFGRTLLMQSLRMPDLELRVLCDLDIEGLKDTCRSVGLDDDRFAPADTVSEANAVMDAGKIALTHDPSVAIDAEIDVLVEATGNAEAGARNCLRAIDQGRHIALVNKETDSVVGPVLTQLAGKAGLVLSQVDGDQPSLLLGLLSWAKALGLEVVCAGKASEYDFVFDPSRSAVHVEGMDGEVDFDPGLWALDPDVPHETLAARSELLSSMPQRTPPDYCEMCLVANASGLKPDRPDFHAPVARVSELPDIFKPATDGGVLGEGRLDIFNCFRRIDEVSAAGGVFAVLRIPDAETGELFRSKGMPVSTDGGYLLVYNPTHLLGVEAGLSVLVPHRLGLPTGSAQVAPVCDVGMIATADFPAGTILDDHGHHHHRINGVEALLLDYAPVTDVSPLPYFMAMGATLTRDMKAGEMITRSAVSPPDVPVLWELRTHQDTLVAS
ncbi:MAG: flagellar biosynthesis protein FlgA [Alphaproteobacteria bacterium]|nr:flagellar biosynthesis protein FlgA [Alphaproteobacteria bacterium]